MAATAYHVPGVYYEPRPRTPEASDVRTDVVGFIGFDPRVRNGSTPSALIGGGASGHEFRVGIAGFQIELNDVRYVIPPEPNFLLSKGSTPATIPITPGESIVYGLAVGELNGRSIVLAHPGSAAPSTFEQPPTDAALRGALAAAFGFAGVIKRFVRLADITVRRDGAVINVASRPGPELAVTRCDDVRDYDLAFGPAVDDGTLLGTAVRAFFANGGRRCWVAPVRRPGFDDAKELARVLEDMVGVLGSSQLEATGLERLLLIRDVTVVDAPDLYALRVDRTTTTFPLPPSEREACFLPCTAIPPKGVASSTERVPALTPIFTSDPLKSSQVFLAQAALLARCVRERWRVLLLLSVPRMLDGGAYVNPTDVDARVWVDQFDQAVKGGIGLPSLGDTEDLSCAAMYWPWLLYQERVDAPVLEMPPSAYAAGIIARRDLARGPEISPANETLRGVVAVAARMDDDINAMLYDREPDSAGRRVAAVNVMRAFPGYGLQLWGARTLSTELWLRFISVRRTLTAIELRMKAALDLLVFEPNRPALWLQITQTAFSVLLPLFESGALRGERPEEAFYVRCDGRVNPPDAIARGELLVEVGVAVAAPAEFIVFRVGRREGVIEVLE
jgi:hypothetical protein